MLYLTIILGIFTAELFIKNYMDKKLSVENQEEICNGRIILNKSYNKGAALNFLERYPKALLGFTISLIVGLFILFFNCLTNSGSRAEKLGFAFVLGGALSNLYDRISKGHVIDYFSFRWKKIRHIVFNLADLFVFLGCFLLMITNLIKKK